MRATAKLGLPEECHDERQRGSPDSAVEEDRYEGGPGCQAGRVEGQRQNSSKRGKPEPP